MRSLSQGLQARGEGKGHRAPLLARMVASRGIWIYLDRAGPEGLSGWIAPRDRLAAEKIEITVAGARLVAPLKLDDQVVEGRPLYRFELPWPLRTINLVTLRFGRGEISLLTLPRGSGKAPMGVPVPIASRRAKPAPAVRGKSLVVLAPIDWAFRLQRSQHLSKALGAHYAATYYLGPGSLRVEGDMLSAEGVRFPALGKAPECDLSLREPSAEEADSAASKLSALIDGNDVDVLVQFPTWLPLARRLRRARILYDCMDRHEALSHVSARIASLEKELVREAVLCTATSAPLLQHLRSLGAAATLLLPNAALPPRPQSWPDRRRGIVYVGAVEAWFDFELVVEIARAMPHTQITVIGRLEVAHPSDLPANVILAGELPHARAMSAMRKASVGIIPFKQTELIEAVNPVKAYEYLCAGLPVVMTPMSGEGLAHAPGVATASSPADFVKMVKAAYDATDQQRREYAAWAATQTWDERARVLWQHVSR